MKLTRSRHVKLLLQKAVSFFPGALGFKLNQKLVDISQGELEKRFDVPRRIRTGIAVLSSLREAGVTTFKDQRVLELGTGWHLVDPILFWIYGASHTDTVDHHRHFQLSDLKHVLQSFCDSEVVADILKAEIDCQETARDRLNQLKEFSESNIESEQQFLDFFKIKFWLSPHCRVDPLVEQSNTPVNIFYSNSVLQRIKTHELERIIQLAVGNLLGPNAISYHRTDQKDINAQEHVDPTAWSLAYLKYSDWFYDSVLSCRFNYQNRLRASDFMKMLEDAGLTPVSMQHSVSPENVDRISKLKLAKRFNGYQPKDLAAIASTMISIKK